MNAPATMGRATGGVAGATADSAQQATAGLGQRMRSVCAACRQIFGMPDYDRYLAHAARTHPGAPVLSRRDYCARMIDRKYGKNAGRCC